MIFANLIANGIIFGLLYGLQAVGLNLLWGIMRVVNMAHGEMFIYSAFVVYFLTSVLNFHPLFTLVPVLVFAIIIGYILYSLVKQFLGREMESLLLTFGISYVLINLGIYIFTPTSRSLHYLPNIVTIGYIYLPANKILVAGITIFIISGIFLWLKKSVWGMVLRGVAENRVAAEVVGVNSSKTLLAGWLLAVAITCCTGGLYAMAYAFNVFSGQEMLLKCFAVSVLGGLGNLGGSLVAGLILGIGESIVAYVISSHAATMLAFFTILGILLARPSGLFGGRV